MATYQFAVRVVREKTTLSAATLTRTGPSASDVAPEVEAWLAEHADTVEWSEEQAVDPVYRLSFKMLREVK